jgi:hypothetical protein
MEKPEVSLGLLAQGQVTRPPQRPAAFAGQPIKSARRHCLSAQDAYIDGIELVATFVYEPQAPLRFPLKYRSFWTGHRPFPAIERKLS